MALSLKRLNQIPDKQKFIVFGYIRNEQNKSSLSNVPLMIMYLCLGYFTEPYRFSLLSVEQARKLKVGDKIDFRFRNGKFMGAQIDTVENWHLIIIAEIEGDAEGIQLEKDPYRLAKPGSISERTSYRFKELKIGDCVDVKPLNSEGGWRPGLILEIDEKSSQVQVGFKVYKTERISGNSWVHLDNEDEIAMRGSKKSISQDLKKYDEYLRNVDYSKDALDEDEDALNELDDALMETLESDNIKSMENEDRKMQSEKGGFCHAKDLLLIRNKKTM